jgi:hypothetical protein
VEPKNSCNHVPGFQAELRVVKQEPDGPRERLVQRLSHRHRHHIPRPQYIGTDRAHPEGPLITPALSTVTSEKSQGASGRVLGVAACPQGKWWIILGQLGKTKSFWCRWFYTRSGQAILYSRFGAPRNVNEKDWSHLVAEVLLVTSG